MGDGTGIQWTEATWNPVTGCSKVSPGCAHCYAETLTARYAGSKGWIEEHRPWTPENAPHNVRLRPERLDQPLRWRRPRMVFVNSMSDLFHEQVPDDYIGRVWATMAAAPQHTFQVLTKRPERMRDLLTDEQRWTTPWRPLPNVWLGTSIENRRFVGRADALRETPSAVRFISAEPLLGPLVYDSDYMEPGTGAHVPCWSDTEPTGYMGMDPTDDERTVYPTPELNLTGIDWLIVGGESGPGHRPMRLEWVRDLRDITRCDLCDDGDYRGGRICLTCCGTGRGRTAFFFKQWGGATPKAGGRELDGKTWDEMPTRQGVGA